MQAWKIEQDRLREEEEKEKEEEQEKEEKLQSKRKSQDLKGSKQGSKKGSKASNRRPSEGKYQNESAKATELEEDHSIPETCSEKVYKVRSCIIIPHQKSANYIQSQNYCRAIIYCEI